MLLAKANDVQVNVTQSEFEQIVQNSIGYVASSSPSEIADWKKSEVDGCNSIDYSGPNPEEEITCDNLGKDLAPLMIPGRGLNSNVSLTAAEIAFARACTAPQNNAKPAFGCMDLGVLYEYEGKPELALAVYQNAEKCQGTLVAEPDVLEIDPDHQVDWTNRERKECLKNEVAILYRMHRYDAERNVATILCKADSEMGCGYLKSLGADVNMRAVEQQQAKLQAVNKATAAADYAADAKASAEANAKFSAEMQALRSLPGGSDPNAIVDTANQQAANINALGAADDAASHSAAERNAQEQAAEQHHEAQASSVATSGSDLQNSNAGSSDTPTYTYTHPATDCLSYAADPDTQGILVTNNCKDQIILTWARPAGTKVGLDHAIQGGPDIVPAGGTDPIPPHPVRVFACHDPGTPTKPGQENSSSDWQLEYADTSFICPALNHAVKTP